jgi:RimJ/RimL family protein N-acetyltransferase
MNSPMSEIPELRSTRLLLRAWRSNDAEAWGRICGDPVTMRYIGDGSPIPPHRAWHGLASFLGHWALRGYGMWAVADRSTGDLVGRTGLYHPEGWPGIELGWLFDRSRWGEGLATEAARLAAAWTWESLDTDRIIHLIRPENQASIRVAEKIGASLAERIELGGRAVDVYALARPTHA